MSEKITAEQALEMAFGFRRGGGMANMFFSKTRADPVDDCISAMHTEFERIASALGYTLTRKEE